MRLKNGSTGIVSSGNPNSRLAKLVAYVLLCRQQGTAATKKGFVNFHYENPPEKMPHDVFQLAIANGYVKYDEKRRGKEKVLLPGPKAHEVILPSMYAELLKKERANAL
jgi:hypothetical protein